MYKVPSEPGVTHSSSSMSSTKCARSKTGCKQSSSGSDPPSQWELDREYINREEYTHIHTRGLKLRAGLTLTSHGAHEQLPHALGVEGRVAAQQDVQDHSRGEHVRRGGAVAYNRKENM
jgi:hypothetical protein